MSLVDSLRRARDMAERSDDHAYTNGTIDRIDAEIRRLSTMTPGEQLLDAQERQGRLTPDQQRDHFEVGMIVRIYDPSTPQRPWNTGRIVRKFEPANTGCTIVAANGVIHSAPYGERIRIVGYAIPPRGLSCGDLFAPLN